jgi:hypothetical protein
MCWYFEVRPLGGLEGGSLINGISVLSGTDMRDVISVCLMREYSKKVTICK